MEAIVKFDFDAYQQHVLSYSRALPSFKLDLYHAALGLVSEAGEFCDAVKAEIIYGKKVDPRNINEEGGDGLWFAGLLARHLQWSFQEIVEAASELPSIIVPERLTGYTLRLADAASSISVRIADHVEDEYPLNLRAVKEDLRRYINYIGRIGYLYGFSLVQMAQGNIAKLDTRYGKGNEFSAERGLNRDKGAELQAIADSAGLAGG
jgi:NTP pyrophosphatase (non-canonical NTP hydrolase)